MLLCCVVCVEDVLSVVCVCVVMFVDVCWLCWGDGCGFMGVCVVCECDGVMWCVCFVFEVVSDDDDDEGDEGWCCVGVCVVEDLCVVCGCEGVRNGMMWSVVVDDAMRRRGYGAAFVRRATAFAFAEWDVVMVWCEKGLVKFYESCGYVYELVKG